MGSSEQRLDLVDSLHAGARPLWRHELPSRQTSFVGRSMELAELVGLFESPDCRMVTVIGAGGIGKTRLALEVAKAIRDRFADGVVFVPLQSVSAADSIAPTIASTLGLPLTGHEEEREQVARVLRPLQLLLVLDNFEHLTGEAPWLGELLEKAPGLRALVTSREALNIREEWRYPLAGLATTDETGDDPAQSEAVRLFVERARQVRREFSLDSEREGVIRLCRITEGLPLALELAAVWVKMLSAAAIADEIDRNIGFLESTLNNVPARHRSMHAAFDYSWALLSDDERAVFCRLSVFRGGFRRDAAEGVASATLLHLSSLIDKSLLRSGPDGRFVLHELLRQYAEARLRADPAMAAQTDEKHRDFYLGFLAARRERLAGGDQHDAEAEISEEWDNVRTAWRSAVAAGDVENLSRGSHALTMFCDIRTHHREAIGLLEEGMRAMRAAPPSPAVELGIAGSLVDVARFYHHVGQLPAMRAAIEESEAIYARLGEQPPPGHMTDPGTFRSLLALIDGDYVEAARLAGEAIDGNTSGGRLGSLQLAWWVRAAAALWQEDTAAAAEYARQSTEAALAVGDRWYLTYGRNMQGHVARARGEYEQARQHYTAGYAIREEFNDPEGMGTALAHLGSVAALQGNWQEAELILGRSLDLARGIGDRITVANALDGLSAVHCATGDFVAAGLDLAEGLRLISRSGFMRLLLKLMASAGDWLLQTGHPTEAVETLALVQAHPAADHETRTRAGHLLNAAMSAVPADVYDAAVGRGREAEPDTVVPFLIPDLTAPPAVGSTPAVQHGAPDRPASASPNAAAGAGLSPRQIEVLHLVARGMTDAEIADELFISTRTVSGHLQSIYNKLGISSRSAATAFAYEHHLVRSTESRS